MNNRSFISLILSVSWQLNLEQTGYVKAKKLKTMCSVIGSFNSKLQKTANQRNCYVDKLCIMSWTRAAKFRSGILTKENLALETDVYSVYFVKCLCWSNHGKSWALHLMLNINGNGKNEALNKKTSYFEEEEFVLLNKCTL